MILTHLIFFGFFPGAGVGRATISGGYREPYRDLRLPPTREEARERIRKSREEYGIVEKAAEVIAAVAERQADELSLDQQRQLDELKGELELAGLTLETRYIEALNAQRQRLIDEEIGRRLRAQLEAENNARMALILLSVMA